MHVLIMKPRKSPHVAEIDGSLKSMQEIVGGYIEAICPFADKVAIVCNEEGKLKPDTEWNRLIPECNDVIKGTFFICGVDGEEFTDLSPELAEKYRNYFRYPLKLSITLDTFPTRIMKRSVRQQPLRRIFAALQQEEAHRLPSRSCGCSSNS